MTWAGVRTTLKANVALAAADVSPVVPLVVWAEPAGINNDTIALWPEGIRVSSTGGNTLTKVNIERGVRVTVYLRVTTARPSAAADESLEDRLVAVEEALFIRLWADADVGGNAIAIAIEESEYGWMDVAGQLTRTVSFVVWVDLAEVATISL